MNLKNTALHIRIYERGEKQKRKSKWSEDKYITKAVRGERIHYLNRFKKLKKK